MSSNVMCWLASFLFLACAQIQAQEKADPSLTLKDIHGQPQRPFNVKGKAASIVFFVTQDCPISNRYAREIHRICDDYSDRARCSLVYTDPDVTPAKIDAHMAVFGHGAYPAIIDAKQALVKAAGATVTPEVAVVVAGGSIAYRGRIDNTYVTWGKSRREATETDLRNALDQVVQGKPVSTPRTRAVGCYITPVELLGR